MELNADPFREKRILLMEDNPKDEALTLRALQKHNLQLRRRERADGVGLSTICCRPAAIGAAVTATRSARSQASKVDGLEVLRRLRDHERTRLLPIVILTSSVEDVNFSKAIGSASTATCASRSTSPSSPMRCATSASTGSF